MARKIEVTLYNKGKQPLPIQVREPSADFYKTQEIRLFPGKSVTIPKEWLLKGQVENLQSMGMLRVTEK